MADVETAWRPGPMPDDWDLSPPFDPSLDARWKAVLDTDGNPVAIAIGYRDSAQVLDRAALIAAAPDMYEALKAAKRALSSMDISSASSEAALEKVRAALAKARAAKAEG